MSDPMPIPAPLYPCSEKGCSEDCAYPADMLYWYETGKRWVCENCWPNLDREGGDAEGEGAHDPARGETLAAYLARTALPAASPPADVRALLAELREQSYADGQADQLHPSKHTAAAAEAALLAACASPPAEAERLAAQAEHALTGPLCGFAVWAEPLAKALAAYRARFPAPKPEPHNG